MSNFSATLDARVVDFGCVDYFGIAEVKCLCHSFLRNTNVLAHAHEACPSDVWFE